MTTPLNGAPTFGASRFFATASVVNPTPARAFVPQSQSIDFKRKIESLFGESQLAVAVGAGEMEISGKVEYGKWNARIFSDIMFGDAQTTGNYAEADGELGTPIGTPPLVTVANSATYIEDLGVIDVTTGAVYSCVASAPVSGKSYMVAAGVYTFATGDTGAKKVSYLYTSTTVGVTVSLTNQPQGLTGQFKAVHVFPWGTEQDIVVFNNCLAASSGISAKKSGFGSFTLDYSAGADTTGAVGTMTFAEAA